MLPNPFKPTAGKMPPILIGRQPIIDDFTEGLINGAGAPGRLMLITGQRGYGKTVMLTELGRVARAHGWDVVSETASEGMCQRLCTALSSRAPHMRDLSVGPAIGIPGVLSASLGSATFSAEESALSLREAIETRLKKLKKGKGIVFTIDEAQAASMEDMTALATALQHVIRDEDMRDVSDMDKHGVALVFAALPSIMDELLQDKVLTFLRRSTQRDLGSVPLADVRRAYVAVVEEAGLHISDEDALVAARASEGYPYMIQLIGYHMWRAAMLRGAEHIERRDVEAGLSDAVLAFDDAVCAPLLDGLTAAQLLFVKGVAQDAPEPTRVSDLQERLNRSRSWVGKYRTSLMREHMIEEAGRGLVRLTTPHLAEYLNHRR